MRRPVVGELCPRFEDVRRIAVLRGGGLGDLMFVLPAAEALAAAYPGAEITLLGVPAHAALLAGRPSPFATVEVLPFRAGVRPGPEDAAATADFLARMRSRQFDLAVQLHGGGRNSNPFLLELGARHSVGTRTEDATPLERTVPYLFYQHEVLRHLEVAALAGAAPVDLEPRMRLTEAEARTPARSGRPLVVVHPSATDPRRRWPAESFGQVAARLVADGVEVVVTGDAADEPLAGAVVTSAEAAGAPAGSVRAEAGTRDLAGLVELLRSASVVLANDSGPRHLAAALGTPTVTVYWVGNTILAAPLQRGRHRVQISWTTHCPLCGRDATWVGWTAERCEHDLSFVADVGVDPVHADVAALLAGR